MKWSQIKLRGDTSLWVVFFLLCVISVIAVYSTIGLVAESLPNTTPMKMFIKHAVFVLTGFVGAIVISFVNYRKLTKLGVLCFYLSLVCLVVVLFTADRRWLPLPIFSFQPSEMAKVFLILFLARMIVTKKETLQDKKTFYELLIPILGTALLIAPGNLSTAMLVVMASYITLYFGGVSKKMWWKWLVIGVIGGVALLGVFYLVGDKIDIMRSGTWGHRLQAWLHPNPDELSQENMARMAIARGGLFGNGIGTTIHGRLMTQAHNDFIFAIIIEEAGTFAATIILALYAWFYFRCIRIATSCPGTFGSVFVAGMGTLILLQAIINMLVATGVFPVTGQTLPFISHGGSSFLFLGVGMGLIQSVAADNKRRERLAKKQAAEEEAMETSEAETVAQPAV